MKGSGTTSQAAAARRGRPRVGDFVWHIHHDRLCDLLTEPLENRIAFIKANKPPNEVTTRLRWMTPVRSKIPAALEKVRAAYDKAGAALDKAGDTLDEAGAAYDKVWAAYDKAGAAFDRAGEAAGPVLARLHTKEHPGCPWNGTRLVFP